MRTALLPASLLAAALALPCAAPAHASILVTIDKTTQRMSIAVDGATRYVWPVSTGRPGYDTPNGTFRPFRMEADHFSKEWDDAPMPHSVFFTKIGHAIHGSLDTRHLGSAASHGCVRLSPEHASDALRAGAGRRPDRYDGRDCRPDPDGDSGRGAPPRVGRSRRRPAAGHRAGLRSAGRAYYGQQPAPYGAQPQPSYYGRPPQPYYGQQPQPYYGQPQPYYAQRQYDGQPQPQTYDRQPPPAYRQLPAAAQPGYALPPQPPPPQFFAPRPLLFN